MLKIVYTTAFRQDFKKVSKQNKDLSLIGSLIEKLSQKTPIGTKYKDHPLVGNYRGKRECHITPDWLLIYEIDQDKLVLHRTGSHSELFK